MVILDLGKFNSKELIRDVIIIALFVNFSLFAARVVIDTGNIVALGFYDAIAVSEKSEVESGLIYKTKTQVKQGVNRFVMGVPEKDVSGNLVSAFNPARLVSAESFKIWADAGRNNSAMILVFVLAACINLYTAYLFFMAGFIFIVRIVYLWVYMAVAPLAFIAYIIPGLRKYWTKWWTELVDKSFCIVMFLFWIWLTLMIVGNDFFKGLFDPTATTGFINFLIIILLQFMIVITLLRKSLEYTKKMCDDGGLGDKVFGLVKTAAGFAIPGIAGAKTAGAALKAATGIPARQILGKSASMAAGALQKTEFATGRTGRMILQGTRAIEKTKFGTQESFKDRTERVAKEQATYMKTLPKEITTKAGEVRKPQEEYREKIEKDWTAGSIISAVSGKRGGETKFIKDLKKKEDVQKEVKKITDEKLKPAQRELEEAKDNLKIIKDSGATPDQVKDERDKVFDVQQKVDKIKEDIKKEKEKLKPKK
ncbi:hypothetical protein ACFL05_00940 [Patescibacteria group bacterium]